MSHHNISSVGLLVETLRIFGKLLPIAGVIALLHAVMYFFFDSSILLAVLFSVFYTLLYFSAPIASSSARARRRVRLFSAGGGITLLFCFVWGSLVVVCFIATLQVMQGMEAAGYDYAVAMTSAGSICVASSMLPKLGN